MGPTSSSSTSSDALAAWAATLTEPAAPRRRPHRTYRATWLEVAAIAAAADGRVRARAIGRSVCGEPIWCLAVDHGAPRPGGSVLVFGGLHAMEHVGPAVAVELLRRASGRASAWAGRRLLVVPIANPDGFRAVEASLARGERRLLRRNARGVDLNRNFVAGWDGGYYLHLLARPLFHPGAGPLSEPETAALDALAAEERPRAVVSLHAFGEWIYTPYAGSRRSPPDAAELLSVGQAMASRQPGRPYRVGQLGRRSRLFAARGAEIDHFYENHGALSFLIEIGAGPSPLRPSSWLTPYDWYTPPPVAMWADVGKVLAALEYLAVMT